jgi:uncharacterized protein (TIGR02145 family)
MKQKTKTKILLYPMFTIAAFFILAGSCKKDDNNQTPASVIDIDGNVYNTLTIGTQVWLAENLKTTKYRNGDTIGTTYPATINITGETNPKYQWAYDGNENFAATYGRLYTWYAVTDNRYLCPSGWHVPSEAEWTILSEFLGGDSIAGGKLKQTGTSYWNNPNTGATNQTGFSALPGGYRDDDGFFADMGNYGLWWTETEFKEDLAKYMRMGYNYTDLINSDYLYGKSYGFSVRCLKDESASTIPAVTTTGITNLTQNTATCGGNVTSEGGATVTARGVCWSTSQNPTIADSHTSDSTGIGIFESNLEGLTSNTPYHVRAYATNSAGTAYGNQVDFTTQSGVGLGEPCPGLPTITYEGQIYNTVQIGSQCWFKENLNVGTMIEGGNEQTNNSQKEKYCYGDDPVNCSTYGGLYQWNEMMQYSATPGVQGICPVGWHLPTSEEWTILFYFLGGQGIAGGKMKEAGFAHWDSPNTDATNESGFTALPGGAHSNDDYDSKGRYAIFWSSTVSSGACSLYLSYYEPFVYNNSGFEYNGFSVRCVKN